MQVDIAYLKTRGVSPRDYKKLFTLQPEDRPAPLRRLYEQIRERIKAGMECNLRDYKVFSAIDLAYEAPFNQTTPTLVQNILSRKLDATKTYELLKNWGISEEELFLTVSSEDGTRKKILNPPVFFNLLIPVVKAYTTIRAAKLFVDRNKSPLLPYIPLKMTNNDRVACEIVTDLVEVISSWLGYPAVMREGIMQAMKYGVALSFPREEWYEEKQVFEQDGVARARTLREGLRYTFPHPSRMFYDLQYPLTTINSDTGVEFGGYWEVVRYGDILDNRMLWNRRQITFGTNWFDQPAARNYFAEVYPCYLEFPPVPSTTNSREERFAMYSPATDRDKPVFWTNYFTRIVPATFGLGDYKYPVWHRFVVAGDDNVLWASPCAYNPMWFMGCDYDPQAATQSSVALESIPFQDHLGNILTQIILTAKQNLSSLVFYDTNMINPSDITAIKNLGEQKYRSTQYVPYDSLKMQRAGVDKKEAFHVVQFPYKDINPLLQTMSGVLNIMERVLQMSAQEVGAAAQHYQSAAEVRLTANATTNRLAYTGTFVDDGIVAWKQQLYDASMSYMDASVLAEISEDVDNLAEVLTGMGFSIEAKTRNRVLVRGNKRSLQMQAFARNVNDVNRENNTHIAQVIYQTIGVIAGNQVIFQQVGAQNILKLLEDAAKLSGAPATFKLPLSRDSKPEDVKAWTMQQLQAMQQNMVESIQKNVVQPAAQKAQDQDAQLMQLQQLVQQLTGIFEVAKKQQETMAVKAQEAQQQTEIKAHEAQSKMAIEQARFEADQARKQAAHEAELARKAEAAAVDAELKVREEAVDEQIKQRESEEEMRLKAKETQADIESKKRTAKASPAKSGAL